MGERIKKDNEEWWFMDSVNQDMFNIIKGSLSNEKEFCEENVYVNLPQALGTSAPRKNMF